MVSNGHPGPDAMTPLTIANSSGETALVPAVAPRQRLLNSWAIRAETRTHALASRRALLAAGPTMTVATRAAASSCVVGNTCE